MRVNFYEKINSFTPEYRKELEETISVFLDGTFQTIRLMNQQGSLLPCRTLLLIVEVHTGRW